MNPKSNTNSDVKSVLDLIDVAGQMKASTVVIAGGDRVDDLSLVESARDHGIIQRIILVGNRTGIEQAVEQVGIEVHDDDIVAAMGENYCRCGCYVRIKEAVRQAAGQEVG